jgi:hypothetical protein
MNQQTWLRTPMLRLWLVEFAWSNLLVAIWSTLRVGQYTELFRCLVLSESVRGLVYSVQADLDYGNEQQVVGDSGSDCVRRVHIRLTFGFFLHTTCRHSRF